jgi:hypothetical protein
MRTVFAGYTVCATAIGDRAAANNRADFAMSARLTTVILLGGAGF